MRRERSQGERPARSVSTARLRAAPRPTSISPPTRFFGRLDDLERVARAFASGTRLLTLLGPAGIGKTRLALRALQERESAGNADLFCDLTTSTERASVIAAVARACSVPLLGDSDSASAVGDALAARERPWVVLDNCEGAVEAVAELVSHWMQRAPNARFFATSRTRLDVQGERALELGPLELEGAALELFLDRAALADAGRVVQHDRATSAAIVRKLDGIPLAIELAAARCALLSPKEILSRLDDRFTVLAAGARDLAPRQRTLRAAIDVSWDPLSEVERNALAVCSVFRGGFDLEAAQAVVVVPATASALDVLQSLRNRSMLRALPAWETTRFGFYESIRFYAEDRLAERGARVVDEARDRHAAYFSSVASTWSTSWARHGDVEALERLSVESDNLAEAHDHALSRAERSEAHAEIALRLMNARASLFIARGPTDEYERALDRTLAAPIASRGSRGAVSAVLLRRGYLRAVGARWVEARRDLNDALAAAQVAGDEPLQGTALRILGSMERMAGNARAAREALTLAEALARRLRDSALLSLVLLNLAQLDHLTGRLAAARQGLIEVRRLEERDGVRSSFGLLEHTLGGVLQELGELAAARIEHEAAVGIARRRDHRHYLGWFLLGLAQLEHELGALGASRARYEEALSVARQLGDRLATALTLGGLAALGASSEPTLAMQLLDQADSIARSLEQPRLLVTLALFRGLSEVALGGVALSRARERAFAAGDAAVASDDVRFARRLLERALQAHEAEPERAREAEALVVAEDGAWFHPPLGARVELRDRPLLRALLRALVQARLDAPGAPLSMATLARSGWPEEKILPAAAANRVHVSLTRLRKLGLLVRSADGGHLLDPATPIRLAPA